MKFITLRRFLFILTLLSVVSITFASTKLAKSTNKEPISVFNRRTPANYWGNNNIFYLDRHFVNCGSQEALQGFRLFRPRSNQLQYKYVCKPRNPSISTQVYNSSTPLNATAGNKSRSANYLDRHNVLCRNGYALQAFKLGRGGNRININYRCVKVTCVNRRTVETNKSINGGYQTIYLDRQDTRVKANEVLVGFHLISRGGTFSY